MLKHGLALFCFLLLMSVTNAHAQDVAVDFDRSVDFARFKTYSWVRGVPAKNPLIDRNITASVDEHLAAKGLRRVEEGADVTVFYVIAIENDLEVSSSYWRYTGDWMRGITSGVQIRGQMWDVEIGTLVVCLSDGSTKNLLWRGTAKTMLDKKSTNKSVVQAMKEDAKKVEKKIKKSLTKMFKQYPLEKSAALTLSPADSPIFTC